MTEVNNGIGNQDFQQEEQEIDIMELVVKLWKKRKTVLIWCAVGAVIGLVVGFSIPSTYSASAVLAPETEESVGSGVSSIASMMGVNLDNSVDAINFQIFPDVVSSTPFIYELFDLPVEIRAFLQCLSKFHLLLLSLIRYPSHLVRTSIALLISLSLPTESPADISPPYHSSSILSTGASMTLTMSEA